MQEECALITNVLLPRVCLGVLQETEGRESPRKRKEKAANPRNIQRDKGPGQLAGGTSEGVCCSREGLRC